MSRTHQADDVYTALCAAPRLLRAPVDVLRICVDFAFPPLLKGHWGLAGALKPRQLGCWIRKVLTTTDYVVVQFVVNATYHLRIYNDAFKFLHALPYTWARDIAVSSNRLFLLDSRVSQLQMIRLDDVASGARSLNLDASLRNTFLYGSNDRDELLFINGRSCYLVCCEDGRILRRFTITDDAWHLGYIQMYATGVFIHRIRRNLSTLQQLDTTSGELMPHVYYESSCTDGRFYFTCTRNAEFVVMERDRGEVHIVRDGRPSLVVDRPWLDQRKSKMLSEGDGSVLIYQSNGSCCWLD